MRFFCILRDAVPEKWSNSSNEFCVELIEIQDNDEDNDHTTDDTQGKLSIMLCEESRGSSTKTEYSENTAAILKYEELLPLSKFEICISVYNSTDATNNCLSRSGRYL